MKKGVLFLLMGLFAACSQPRIIPDDQLSLIFRDAFVTDAYLSRNRIASDSLKVYEPIFAQYGYTPEDVQYTIANFSKRKSARLSDVVEEAIRLLDQQGAVYDREVAILDTIDNAARRALTRVIYSDTLIRVKQLRDTSRLRIVIPDIKPGEYKVSLRYMVDSLDENTSPMRGGAWFDRSRQGRPDYRSYTLRRFREDNYQRTLKADTADKRLIVDFAGFSEKPRRPSLTIRDLQISYTPPAAVAVDSFYRRQLDVRIFNDRFFPDAIQKDSL